MGDDQMPVQVGCFHACEMNTCTSISSVAQTTVAGFLGNTTWMAKKLGCPQNAYTVLYMYAHVHCYSI